MDPVLGLLLQAHGDQLGRMIWGAYRLAATAVEHAQQREKAEAALRELRDGADVRDLPSGGLREVPA